MARERDRDTERERERDLASLHPSPGGGRDLHAFNPWPAGGEDQGEAERHVEEVLFQMSLYILTRFYFIFFYT